MGGSAVWPGQAALIQPHFSSLLTIVPVRETRPFKPRKTHSVGAIHRGIRSGTLWLGQTGRRSHPFRRRDGKPENYPPDSRDPHKLNGGAITAIHEDRAELWVGAWDGLYRFIRKNESFTRYTEAKASRAALFTGRLEDGRLWLGAERGVSRFRYTKDGNV